MASRRRTPGAGGSGDGPGRDAAGAASDPGGDRAGRPVKSTAGDAGDDEVVETGR